MLPLLAAVALGAAPLERARTAPLDRARAAVFSIIRDGDAAGCDPPQIREAAAAAEIKTLGRVGGSDVVLATVEKPCICGNANCPYYVIQLDPKPRLLYSTFGIALHTIAASPLPMLVVAAHDSALVIDETTVAYRNGAYADLRSERVRADNGARKPDDVPVRFAPGASSTALRGTASSGWYDAYSFVAQAGQRLILDAHAKGRIIVTLSSPHVNGVLPLTLGKPLVLPRTATYRLWIEIESETGVPYVATFTIR